MATPVAVDASPIAAVRRNLARVIRGKDEAIDLLLAALAARSFRTLVLHHDRRQVQALREHGVAAVYGDPTHPLILEHAGLDRARVLVVMSEDPVVALNTVRTARHHAPNLDIVAVARSGEQQQALLREGATETVVADLEAGLEVTRHVLHRFGVEARQIQLLLQRLRLGS